MCDVQPEELAIGIKMRRTCQLARSFTHTARGPGMQSSLRAVGQVPVIGGKNIVRYGLDGVKGYLRQEDINAMKKKIAFLSQPKIR